MNLTSFSLVDLHVLSLKQSKHKTTVT